MVRRTGWPALASDRACGRAPVAGKNIAVIDFDDLEALVRTRRTNLRMDPDRPVPEELIARLCELATWAPNHKRTWPWRFALLAGDARARLGEVLATALVADGAAESAIAKARRKYLRAPVVLAVASAGDADPIRDAENRDAVAAGVQNLLLGATAVGLASYWGTGEVTRLAEVKELCCFDEHDTIVALLYLGWPAEAAPIPARPAPALYRVPQGW